MIKISQKSRSADLCQQGKKKVPKSAKSTRN